MSEIMNDISWRLRHVMTLGDMGVLPQAADEIERLTEDRDRWRSLAERAMDLLEEANKVLATIQEAVKND